MIHYEPKRTMRGMTVIITGLFFFAIVTIFSNTAMSCAPIASAQKMQDLFPAEDNIPQKYPSYQTSPKLTFLGDTVSAIFPPESDANVNQPTDVSLGAAMSAKPTTEIIQLQPENPTVVELPKTNPEIVKKSVNQPVPKATDIKNKIVSKKIITAPEPYMYKVNTKGQLVCKSNNDKPGKSSLHKKVHMDMECCLDPDEIPNPHCYYPPSKYGKLLNKPGP